MAKQLQRLNSMKSMEGIKIKKTKTHKPVEAAMKNVGGRVIDAVRDVGGDAWGELKTGIDKAWDEIKLSVDEGVDTISHGLSKGWETLSESVDKAKDCLLINKQAKHTRSKKGESLDLE